MVRNDEEGIVGVSGGIAADSGPSVDPLPPLPATADFVVAGAGVVGLTVALELRARHPKASIVVLEKEERPGEHASGRNSGVLHAGFYYPSGSLKASFTRDGNRRMSEWCAENGVPVHRCGKLVVAKSEGEHAQLDELLRRGRENGVTLEDITEDSARQIEPRVLTIGRAIWSPTTSVVNPSAVMSRLANRSQELGIQICFNAAWRGRDENRVVTERGAIDAGYFVNAAGLYADRIAKAYGFAGRYRILPFKGLYLYGNQDAGSIACCVYPVPDLSMPFLGVHFTVTTDGGLKIGPTATPAFWLEQYGEPTWGANYAFREMRQVLFDFMRLVSRNGPVRRLAFREVRRLSRSSVIRDAAQLLTGVQTSHFRDWGRVGIRAQLFDTQSCQLVMDYVIERDDKSLHVLNAVSPAFTCAFPFAAHIVNEIEARAPGVQ